jgi:hypothetical protein
LLIEIITREKPYNVLSNIEVLEIVCKQGGNHPIPQKAHPVFQSIMKVDKNSLLCLLFCKKECFHKNPDDRISLPRVMELLETGFV